MQCPNPQGRDKNYTHPPNASAWIADFLWIHLDFYITIIFLENFHEAK